MNRRNFLGLLAGTAAVWPFRKYFIPPAPAIQRLDPQIARRMFDRIQMAIGTDYAFDSPGIVLYLNKDQADAWENLVRSGELGPITIDELTIGDEPMLKDLVLRGFDPSWPATTKRT